jgi:superfamily II DNA or RNA helicase
MIEIEVGNSYSTIRGMTPQFEKELKKELSYTENADSAYFGGFARQKSLLGKQGIFPTGLFHRVKKLSPPYNLTFTAPPPPRFQFSCYLTDEINPWEDQVSAIHAAIAYNRGIISMPTGTGKSLVAAMLCVAFSVKTLIVVPSLEIKKQLTDDLARYLTKSDFIRVENIDSTALPGLTDFDMLIIDEAHHVAAKTYQRLNRKAWKGIYYRFFLTATSFRNQEDEMLLFEAIAGEVIYKLSYQDAISKGYIVPVEAYYIEIDKKETDGYTYREVYNDLVVNNAPAHQKLVNVMTGLHSSGKSALCLIREVKHGQILSDISGLSFIHGSVDDRRDIRHFNQRIHKVLIGTTGVLGEGVDTKPCEYVVIAGLGKAKSAFMQAVGRAVRRFGDKMSAKVILVRYKGHRFCTRHFKAQCAILQEEYGVKPVKLEV